MALDNSASHSSHILIGQFKRKPPESWRKDVKKLSQSNKKLKSGGYGLARMTASVTYLNAGSSGS